jgi:putative tryptophan/tyrosine transport system ATP-binding protein
METGYSLILDKVSFNPPSKNTKGVLNDISFSVEEGEFVTLIGRNGHGKTSIIKAIAGELEEDYVTGTVKIGLNIIKGPVYLYASGVGIVHQFVQYDLIDCLSILKNIQIRQLFSNDQQRREKASDINWEANLNDDLSKFIKEKDFAPNLNTIVENLSGGQRQLLNVLIALKFEHAVDGCNLLLLDEHLTSLDVVIQKKVMNIIEGLTKVKDGLKTYRNTTIIMVTHDFEYALKYSDKILVIKNGKIIEEILKSETTKWVIEYLEKSIE